MKDDLSNIAPEQGAPALLAKLFTAFGIVGLGLQVLLQVYVTKHPQISNRLYDLLFYGSLGVMVIGFGYALSAFDLLGLRTHALKLFAKQPWRLRSPLFIPRNQASRYQIILDHDGVKWEAKWKMDMATRRIFCEAHGPLCPECKVMLDYIDENGAHHDAESQGRLITIGRPHDEDIVEPTKTPLWCPQCHSYFDLGNPRKRIRESGRQAAARMEAIAQRAT